MAIALRAYSVASHGSAPSSLNVTKPTGVVDGDVMVAFVTISGDKTISVVPTGWNTIGSQTTGTATGDVTTAAYWRRASGEGASYTWEFSAGVDCAIAILAYSGVLASGSPINTSNYNIITGSTLTPACPSVTPSTAPSLVLYAFGVNPSHVGDTTFAAISGLSKRAEADPAGSTTNRAVLCVYDDSKTTTAATGSKTTTINGSAKAVTWSVILTPEGEGGTGTPIQITVQPATQTSTNEGCMLGWYDGSNDVPESLARASEMGTGWAVIRLYHAPKDFPSIKSSSTQAIINSGAIPMVSHKPPHTGGSWIEIYRGDYSSEIDAWVTYYKSLAPAKVIFVFHHEPHDNATDLKPDKGLEGTASDFVKAYRYIAKKFRDANATNVFLGYSAVANTWATKGTPVGAGDTMWPGSDVVDVLCHDEYNTAGEDFSPNPGGGGSGTVSYIGEKHVSTPKGASSITIDVPTGTSANDLLLAILHTDYCNLGTNKPSGWTLLSRREEGYGSSAQNTANIPELHGGTDLGGYIYYKIATGTETSATWVPDEQEDPDSGPIGSINLFTGTIMCFRGVDTSAPIYSYAWNEQTSGDQIDAPSVSGVSGGMLVCGFIQDDNDDLNTPSGMSLVSEQISPPGGSGDDRILIARKSLSSGSSTGIQTAFNLAPTGQSPNDMAMSICIKPGGSYYSYGGTSWHSFEEEYAKTVSLAKRLNKPLIFGEIGSNHSKPQGNRDDWFRDGAAWIKGNEDARNYLKGFCYYHVDNHDGSGHWWRFTNDTETMFKGDGLTGFIQGFVQEPYFKSTPISLITSNETQVEDFTGGIPSTTAFGNPTVSRDATSSKSIFSAGGIASPSDYDVVEEEAGQEFGIAAITQEGVALSGFGIASTLAVGTPTITKGIGSGWIFIPPIRRFNPGILPTTTGIERALRKYYKGPPVGSNVYLMNDGTVTETPTDLNLVSKIYHGGHIVPITDEEVDMLVDAGYAEYITATEST